METARTVRLVLVEDDVALRLSVARVLDHEPGFAVVGQAGSLAEARRVVGLLAAFELALVDLSLPDGDGVDLIRHLRAVHAGVAAVALTVRDDAASVFRTLRAGARGYLIKDTPPSDVPRLLREALAGGAPLSPSIARLVVTSFAEGACASPLTPREHEVLALLVKGLSYRQVGATLGVATGTVQTHVKSIYEKLEVSSKAEATAVAFRRGLV